MWKTNQNSCTVDGVRLTPTSTSMRHTHQHLNCIIESVGEEVKGDQGVRGFGSVSETLFFQPVGVDRKLRPVVRSALSLVPEKPLPATFQALMNSESKCSFAGTTIEYLGHVISGKGVQTDPPKICAIQQWAVPTNLKQLRGFLGLAGYYRRFIKAFGVMARPLTDLLKKDSFKCNEEAQVAFEILKQAFTTAPVLALPGFSKEFVVETDASSKGLGAVLMQEGHPIAFISKALSTRQQSSSVYEKELLAILMAKVTTPLQQTCLAKLMGYNYDIAHKNGSENVAVDGLSRMNGLAIFEMGISLIDPVLLTRIKQSWENDDQLKSIMAKIEEGQQVEPVFTAFAVFSA
ncbi:hypothetical protein E3N88_38383 [Mikania micrantha]|uniref:Reverse transcriptase/retrotransposon-derived protein RNase H-like domain-containing protein n=1 Tax=Mikania micrantha TaxID=192012 RepID=A0A5N6LTT9_9ASTR|nr:hypothetical protein E3N88_38383 [Mikania micrantha]